MGTPIKPMPPIRLVDVPVFPDARETLESYMSKTAHDFIEGVDYDRLLSRLRVLRGALSDATSQNCGDEVAHLRPKLQFFKAMRSLYEALLWDPTIWTWSPPQVAFYLAEIQAYTSPRSAQLAKRLHALSHVLLGTAMDSLAHWVSAEGGVEQALPPLRVVEYFEAVARSRACAIPFRDGRFNSLLSRYSGQGFGPELSVRLLDAWARIKELVGAVELSVCSYNIYSLMDMVDRLEPDHVVAAMPRLRRFAAAFPWPGNGLLPKWMARLDQVAAQALGNQHLD